MRSGILKPVALIGLVAAAALVSQAGRDKTGGQAHQPPLAQGSARLEVRAVTWFGGKGIEHFVSAQPARDGGIVAFGNAWGPEFPDQPEATLLGKGQWYDVSPWLGGWSQTPQGEPIPPSADFPNRAGFIALYSSDLSTLRRVVKFDWGVATITAGAVAPDGDLIISGTCTDHMKSVADRAGSSHTRPNPQNPPYTRYGAVYYEHIELAGDSYVARLSPSADAVRWVWTFKGHRRGATQLTVSDNGQVTFDIRGIKRISADGEKLKEFDISEFGDEETLLAINPADGAFLRGGRQRMGTGRPKERWTKPMLWGYDGNGKHVWQLYDWGPRLVALRENRLLASVDVQAGTYCRNGDFLVAAHVGGPSSVTLRSPIDLHKPIDANALGTEFPSSGGATQLIRIRPKDFAVTRSALWRGKGASRSPSHRHPLPDGYAGVQRCVELPDGSIALLGLAGAGLPHTPGGLAGKSGAAPGSYLAVLTGDLSAVRFSSSAPGMSLDHIAPSRTGLLAAGSIDPSVKTLPSADGAQRSPGGGRLDGALILLGGAE
jgi:hypothetical protein